jgi:hypothetical protein
MRGAGRSSRSVYATNRPRGGALVSERLGVRAALAEQLVVRALAGAATRQRDDVISDGAKRLDTIGLTRTLAGDDRSDQVRPHLVVRGAVAALVTANLRPNHGAPCAPCYGYSRRDDSMTQDEKTEALRVLDDKALRLIGEQMTGLRHMLERTQNILTAHSALFGPILAEAVRRNPDPTATLADLDARLSGLVDAVREGMAKKDDTELKTSLNVVAVATLTKEFSTVISQARDALGIVAP